MGSYGVTQLPVPSENPSVSHLVSPPLCHCTVPAQWW